MARHVVFLRCTVLISVTVAVTFERKQMDYRPTEPGEHYQLIVDADWEKVRQNPNVKQVLLATGDLVLKSDHRQESDATAAWRYFEILTDIKNRLQRPNRP